MGNKETKLSCVAVRQHKNDKKKAGTRPSELRGRDEGQRGQEGHDNKSVKVLLPKTIGEVNGSGARWSW